MLRTRSRITSHSRRGKDGVVPVGTGRASFEEDLRHLVVRDLRSPGVTLPDECCPDLESRRCLGRANELEDGLVVPQGLTGPVAADVAEQLVLDGIPLGGSGRVVADLDAKTEAVAKGDLQLRLPETGPVGVASAAVCQDEKSIRSPVPIPTDLCPPFADGIDGELGSVVGDTDRDEALVGRKVIDPIGNGPPSASEGKS